MDEDNMRWIVRSMLEFIGEDPNREGLKDTPKRVVNMWKEIFRGYDPKQLPKVTTFRNGKDGVTYDQMIMDEGNFNSFCEHHIIGFLGNYYFAYLPNSNGKLLGLSKVARVVDYFSARLQIQERLAKDILDYLWQELSNGKNNQPYGMALVLKAKHLCKSIRGVKKEGYMTTIELRGAFKDNLETRAEFLRFANGVHNGR